MCIDTPSKKNILIILALVIASASLFSGCGAGEGEKTGSIFLSGLQARPMPLTNNIHPRQALAPALSGGWSAYTNPNQVNNIAVDDHGVVWSVGSGGAARWNPLDGTYEQFDVANGLAENYQSALVIAPDGKVWVGSRTGYLSFFDGDGWKTLDRKAGDTITGLAMTADGVLWTGTNRGVYRFDGLNWKTYTTQDGILDNYIQAIATASAGGVWVGMMGGVSYFDGSGWKSRRFPTGTLITAIAEAPDQTLWFGSNNGLAHYDGQTWIAYTAGNGVDVGLVQALATNPGGELWFVGDRMGLVYFDESNQGLVQYPVFNLSSLAFDRNGSLWAGSWFEGISRFSRDERDVFSASNHLVDNFVLSIGTGMDGSVWVGSAGGASKYDGSSWQSFTIRDGLVSDDVLAIAPAPDGSMWFGTENGISHYDGSTWKNYGTQDGLLDKRVSSIEIAPDGMVWGMTREGLSRFDGSVWSSWAVPDGLPNNGIRPAAPAPGGSIWVGTSKGIAYFDGRRWVPVYLPVSDTVSSIQLDERGGLWVGTLKSGVLWIDAEIWNRFPLTEARQVLIDPGGQMRVTANDGVIQVETEQLWRLYRQADGLSGNQINAIAIAPDGSLWAAANQGISVLQQGSWSRFPLPGELENAKIQTLVFDSNGSLWVGVSLGGALNYHFPK